MVPIRHPPGISQHNLHPNLLLLLPPQPPRHCAALRWRRDAPPWVSWWRQPQPWPERVARAPLTEQLNLNITLVIILYLNVSIKRKLTLCIMSAGSFCGLKPLCLSSTTLVMTRVSHLAGVSLNPWHLTTHDEPNPSQAEFPTSLSPNSSPKRNILG